MSKLTERERWIARSAFLAGYLSSRSNHPPMVGSWLDKAESELADSAPKPTRIDFYDIEETGCEENTDNL